MEKIQVTAFCIQEFIISGLYVYYTRQILKPGQTFQKKRTRQVMLHLIYVNVLVILMDIILLCTEYANLYEIQITFKGAVYSVKLRLEFAILNDLMRIAGPTSTSHESPYAQSGRGDIALGTLNNRSQGAQEDAVKGLQSRNYTCTASGQTSSPFAEQKDGNVVFMTTEVVVKNEHNDEKITGSQETIGRIGGSVGNPNLEVNGRSRQTQTAHSSNSSEVEFAGAGY